MSSNSRSKRDNKQFEQIINLVPFVGKKNDVTLKKAKCQAFFTDLSNLVSDYYEIVASCNNDFSAYLVPFGTKEQISYYSKPAFSFRMSDHWNWFANFNKCNKEKYVQCLNVNMPYPLLRKAPGKASDPRKGICVGFCQPNGVYETIYGETYDRKTKVWSWVECKPEDVIKWLDLNGIAKN